MLWFKRKPIPQEYSQRFERDGFLVLEKFFASALCNQIAAEAEAYYQRQNAPIGRVERTMNMHQESPAARRALREPRLVEVLRELLGNEPFFLQSIYFHRGSQQPIHSDYIYMSTDPPMQMCGVWVACEDVRPDAGPLTYYPGSHKIPILPINAYYDANVDSARAEIAQNQPAFDAKYGERVKMTGESILGCYFYERWLDQIRESLKRGGYQPVSFLPKQGDVIVWHANLAHGGSNIADGERSRKSLVAHFLTEAVDKYYDMNYVNHRNYIDIRAIDHKRPAVLQVRS
jgi:ectoine hydroxylase-related dioxygenase (phytanoyl-CoA dioxygenase family)